MNETVILPHTPKRTTRQDITFLQHALRNHRSSVQLRAFDTGLIPIWLADDFGERTLTVTLNNDPYLDVLDYIPGPKFFAPGQSKTDLLDTLCSSDIRTPHSTILHPDFHPDEADFGPYLMFKTMVSGTSRAEGIYFIKTKDYASLRGQLHARYEAEIKAGYPPVAQRFIDTGTKPRSVRVTTFLGAPIVCFETVAPDAFAPRDIKGIIGGQATSNFSSERLRRLCYETGFVEMAKDVARLFPQTPVLSIDMVQCVETDTIYCLEVNLGNLAALSAPICGALRKQLGARDMHQQFGSYDTMAQRLVTVLDQI